MKRFFLSVLGGALLSSWTMAAELPRLTERDWLGVFVGKEEKAYDFLLGTDGQSQIIVKKGSNRISSKLQVKLKYLLYEEDAKGKKVSRSIQEDGFETEVKEGSLKLNEATVIATYTGGHKVEIKHLFKGGQIIVVTKILENVGDKKLSTAVEVNIPSLYKTDTKSVDVDDPKTLKKTLRSEKMSVVTLKGKEEKFKVYERPQLEKDELTAEGVAEIEFKFTLLEKKEFLFKGLKPKEGKITFKQKNEVWNGFRLYWEPMMEGDAGAKPPQRGGRQARPNPYQGGFVISVK